MKSLAGSRIGQHNYDAFGNEWMGTQPDPFGYSGEYYDSESGNIYLRARYYDSEIGRFINEDPIKYGLNWYVYANNNPIMFIDPTGQWAADGSDERFKDSNPVVYEAIGDLSKTWENLDKLEKSGVDIGNKKAEVAALCDEIRRIGDSTTVTTKSITFLWKTANLNATEAVIYASDTNKGWDMLVAGNTAINDTAKMFDNSSDATPANAFQHVYWNSLGVKKTGNASFVKYYTDAHEFGNSYCTSSADEFAKTDMDLFNNGVGRYQQSLNPKASGGKLKGIIYQRLKDGGLKWIKKGDLGNKHAM